MSEKNQADIGENLIHIHVNRGAGAALKRVRGEDRHKIEPAESVGKSRGAGSRDVARCRGRVGEHRR